jgi:hypothetical protein
MKTHLQNLIGIIAFGCLSMTGASANENKVEMLSDQEMASVRGGFCPFEECEASPSGVCQPIPDNEAAICSQTKCTYAQREFLNIVSYGCILVGGDTCSQPVGYSQCIWAFKMSYCSYGATPVCGELVQGDCLPNPAEEVCTCAMTIPGAPCSWTSCTP